MTFPVAHVDKGEMANKWNSDLRPIHTIRTISIDCSSKGILLNRSSKNGNLHDSNINDNNNDNDNDYINKNTNNNTTTTTTNNNNYRLFVMAVKCIYASVYWFMNLVQFGEESSCLFLFRDVHVLLPCSAISTENFIILYGMKASFFLTNYKSSGRHNLH